MPDLLHITSRDIAGDILTCSGVPGEVLVRQPPRIHITGPAPRLPQWEGGPDPDLFTITAVP